MVLLVLSSSTAPLIVIKPSPQILVDAFVIRDGVATVVSDSSLPAVRAEFLLIDSIEFVLPTANAAAIPLFFPDAGLIVLAPILLST